MHARDAETRAKRAARYERGDVTPHPDAEVYEEGEGGFSFDEIDLTDSEREHFDQLVKAGRLGLRGTTALPNASETP